MADGLQEALERHLANDDLIKGWEAERRICNGRGRAPLRKAAREVNAIREPVLAGKASAAAQRKYVVTIETLYTELAKAHEQDFDGMLKEASGWLKAQHSGATEQRLPIPAELTTEQRAALERIRDYRFINSPGHVGRAIDRDLRLATEIAKDVRAGLSAMAASNDAEELVAATALYVDAADRFAVELRRAGEPDFDGLLRQAVLVLDGAPAQDSTSVDTNAACSLAGGKGGAAAVTYAWTLTRPRFVKGKEHRSKGRGKGENDHGSTCQKDSYATDSKSNDSNRPQRRWKAKKAASQDDEAWWAS